MKKASSAHLLKILNVIAMIWLTFGVPTGAAAQTCVPAPSGLIGWWDGDHVSGSTVPDLSGTGNDGTIQGSVTTAPGVVGNAFEFSRAIGNRIAGVLTSGFAGGDAPITTSAWVMQRSSMAHPGDGVLGVGTGEEGPGDYARHFFTRLCTLCDPVSGIWVGPNGQPPDGQNRIWLGADDLGSDTIDKWWGSNAIIANGAWNHIAATYDPATRDVKIYVNGALDRTVTLSVGLRLRTNFWIGGDFYNDNAFDGLIDEAQVYNRALDATEIKAIYDAGSAGVCKRLTVAIDIMPGSDDNSINLGSAGVVPVAILSSPTFDATQVDPASVTLAGAEVRLIGRGSKYSCSAEDVNGDGLLDLLCHIETASFLLQAGDTSAELLGSTFAGQQIQGADSIRIVP